MKMKVKGVDIVAVDHAGKTQMLGQETNPHKEECFDGCEARDSFL